MIFQKGRKCDYAAAHCEELEIVEQILRKKCIANNRSWLCVNLFFRIVFELFKMVAFQRVIPSVLRRHLSNQAFEQNQQMSY